MLKTAFWKEALESLPAGVRERYAGDFEHAERWELALEALVEVWTRAKYALVRAFQTRGRVSQH